MHNIKTYNAIAPVGLARFSANLYKVGAEVEQPDAMLLRSHKLGVDELYRVCVLSPGRVRGPTMCR